jgi:two-component system, OmpR family, phosphate regulon sensor histidine kinase PhoR
MMRRRLLWQLYPSYLILVLVAILATGWYATRSMRLFHLTQIRQELLHQTALLIPQLQPLLAPLQPEALDALCKRLGRDLPSRITVVLPDGSVVADSEADPAIMENHGSRAEIIQAQEGKVGTAVRFSDTIGRHMMYLAVPLGQGGQKGTVRVAIALTAIEEQLHALQVRIAAGGLVIVLLASLVCLWISRRISRPIEQMRRSASLFAAGELTHRLVPPGHRRAGRLGQGHESDGRGAGATHSEVVRQRNETEAVLASMVEGVVALDRQERILHLNEAAARLLDAAPEALQGRTIQEVVRNRELHRMVRETLSRGESGRQGHRPPSGVRAGAGHPVHALAGCRRPAHGRAAGDERRDPAAPPGDHAQRFCRQREP